MLCRKHLPFLHGSLYIFERFLWFLFSLLFSRIKVKLLFQALLNRCDFMAASLPGHSCLDMLQLVSLEPGLHT